MSPWLAWDVKIFLWVNGFCGSSLDYLLGWTTFLGTPILYWIVFVLIWIWDGGAWVRKFVLVLAAGEAASLVTSLLKRIVNRPRPYSFFYNDITHGRVLVHNLFETHVSHSFPSGHATLLFAVAVSLNLIYKNRLWFLYPLAAFLALTRVYGGAHFPSDVAAGSAVGCLMSLLVVEGLKKSKYFN